VLDLSSTNRRFVTAANSLLRFAGARLVSQRVFPELDALSATFPGPVRFTLSGTPFECFAHSYNCGWPYLPTCTERTVELAIADRWLAAEDHNNVVEVGAVTPYYWPRRVVNVVDPADTHPLVNARKSVFDVDLRGTAVLSISTVEHIGTGDYGLVEDAKAAPAAIEKLFRESPRFLVTFSSGYNLELDQLILARRDFPADVSVALLVRNPSGVGWQERTPSGDVLRPYGPFGNSVFVIFRGDCFLDRH
jgi:hypothetical protein